MRWLAFLAWTLENSFDLSDAIEDLAKIRTLREISPYEVIFDDLREEFPSHYRPYFFE